MVSSPLGVFYNASALPRQQAGAGVYTLELGRALAARESLRLDVFAPRDPGFGIWTGTPGGLTGRLAWEEFQLGRLGILARGRCLPRPALRHAANEHARRCHGP